MVLSDNNMSSLCQQAGPAWQRQKSLHITSTGQAEVYSPTASWPPSPVPPPGPEKSLADVVPSDWSRPIPLHRHPPTCLQQHRLLLPTTRVPFGRFLEPPLHARFRGAGPASVASQQPTGERCRLSSHHDEDSIAAAGRCGCWSRGLGAHISDLSQEVEGTLWELCKVSKLPP